jgi:dsRNA-specific ribonuclease
MEEPFTTTEPEPYIPHTDHWFHQTFKETVGRTLEATIAQLNAVTDPRLKHPFYIRGYHERGMGSEIPVHPEAYRNAHVHVATDPEDEGGILFKRVDFGYVLYQEFRRIGVLNFVRIDSSDQVLEVGCGSEEMKGVFCAHLFGTTLSPEERERIRIVHEEIFAFLRNDAQAREQLVQFAQSRGWPAGLEDIAHLAYFDPRITPLENIAALKHFSREEMVKAGWYELSFSQTGQPSWSARDFKVIRIPYFKHGRIELWRTRNLRVSRTTSHKYTSWPLDRAIARAFDVEEKLYYGWDLDKACGKLLVITEGEFKCLVATQMSGVLTVGIPGITEVDETIIQALVAAQASEFIVILDRDPRGKGYMRVDNITDSERAAYGIALDLIRAGAQNVRVGRIPDVKNGQKVGIDDLILDEGVQAYLQVIADAVSPQEYAQAIGLNPMFYILISARQRIRKALEQYEHSARRGGARLDSESLERAIDLRNAAEALYADFLLERFRGAYRINQPSRSHMVLFRSPAITDAEKKIAMTPTGNGIALDRFQDDIIQFQYYPADTLRERMWIGRSDLTFPLSMEDIRQFFETGESSSADLWSFLQQGLESMGKTPESSTYQWESIHELGMVLLAGYLSNDFPLDEFCFIPNLTLYTDRSTYWEAHVRIPLTIFRDRGENKGEVVAFATLVTWDERPELPEGQAIPEAWDGFANALMLASRMWLFVTSFLRERNTAHDETKFKMVIETLYPYWFQHLQAETIALMANFGVSEAMVDQYQLLALTSTDARELLEHFVFRRLLNQATHSGLFYHNGHTLIAPRFQGDIVLLPVLNEEKHIVSLRVLPLTLEDHVPPISDPTHKLIRQIDGGDRHLLKNLDPARHLYLQDRLRHVEGKRLIITFHELDGLIIGSHEAHVVALNSSLEPHPHILAKIRSAAPASVCIVLSGPLPSSRYDDFQDDDIAGYLKDVYDFQEMLNLGRLEPVECLIAVLPFPLTHLAAQHQLTETDVAAIVDTARPLQAYLDEHKFNPAIHKVVRNFLKVNARFLDYLEIQALPDLLDARSIDWWIKENRRLYGAINTYVQQTHHTALPEIEVYFQRKLGLDQPLSLEELVRQRREEGKSFLHKPLYSLEEKKTGKPISAEIIRLFQQIIEERSTVGTQDICNILWPEKRTRKDGLVLIKPAPPQPSPSRKVVDAPVGMPAILNAKGELLMLHQRAPQRYSRPEVIQETQEQGFFVLTVRLQDMLEERMYTGIGRGQRKKDAEALACEQILLQIQKREVPGETVDKPKWKPDAIMNPKGAIYELLQQSPPASNKPSIHSKPSNDGFEVAVTVSYQGQLYAGKGRGRTRREAEREALLMILEIIDGQRTVAGLPKDVVTKIERALQMGTGKNYVGQVYTIAQTLQIKPPQFLTTFLLADDGTAYQTHASFQVTDAITIETNARALFPEISKQEAALKMLTRLSELIQPEEIPRSAVICPI